MDFEDYATRYRPGLDLVLRGITFSIKSEEKVSYVAVATHFCPGYFYPDVCLFKGLRFNFFTRLVLGSFDEKSNLSSIHYDILTLVSTMSY